MNTTAVMPRLRTASLLAGLPRQSTFSEIHVRFKTQPYISVDSVFGPSVNSVLPPSFRAQRLPFPSQVPAFTIFTFKKYRLAVHHKKFETPTGCPKMLTRSLAPIRYCSRNPHGTAVFCTVPPNRIFSHRAGHCRFSGLGASLVFGIWAPGHFSPMSTFPTQVPATANSAPFNFRPDL